MYERLACTRFVLGNSFPITVAAAAFAIESFGSSQSSSLSPAQRWNHAPDLGILFSSPTDLLDENHPYASTYTEPIDDDITMLFKYAEEVPRDELWVPADSVSEATQSHRHRKNTKGVAPSRSKLPLTHPPCAMHVHASTCSTASDTDA